MATVNGKGNFIQHSVYQTLWEAIGATDVGTPDQLSRYPLHSVQIAGTFGGATVVLQGSDDGVLWFTLKDVTGASVSATVDSRFDVQNVPMHTRPSSSGGGITTDVDVIVTSRSLGH
jgi:hypothetical protein